MSRCAARHNGAKYLWHNLVRLDHTDGTAVSCASRGPWARLPDRLIRGGRREWRSKLVSMGSAGLAAWSSRPSATRASSARRSTSSRVVDISTDADYFAYQMKYDSVHGRFKHSLATKKSDPTRRGQRRARGRRRTQIKCVMATKEPGLLPWKDLGVDYVIESHGPVHRLREGQGPPRGRREEGHHLRARQGRGEDAADGRQRGRVRPREAQHRLERVAARRTASRPWCTSS